MGVRSPPGPNSPADTRRRRAYSPADRRAWHAFQRQPAVKVNFTQGAEGAHKIGMPMPGQPALTIRQVHMTQMRRDRAQRGRDIGFFDIHVKQVSHELDARMVGGATQISRLPHRVQIGRLVAIQGL